MATIIERLMIRSIDRLYPEQGWIPKVSAFGYRLKKRFDRSTFDLRLLDLKSPKPLQLLRICHAYARHLAYEGLEIKSRAWAKIYYADCYFLHRHDAEGYFYALFYLRYTYRSICMTFKEIANYFKQVAHGAQSPLDTIRLCLTAFYYDQCGAKVVA